MNSRDRLLATFNFETPEWDTVLRRLLAGDDRGLAARACRRMLLRLICSASSGDSSSWTRPSTPDLVLEETPEEKLVRNGDGMTAHVLARPIHHTRFRRLVGEDYVGLGGVQAAVEA